MPQFYSLLVSSVNKITKDAVVISFSLSNDLKKKFRFKSGQYITLLIEINKEEVRRSYSLCSSPDEEQISIAVKKVNNGKMSTFLNDKIRIGDTIKAMQPCGDFYLSTSSKNNKHYVALCAGSGITPILSMIKKVMKDEIQSTFTLVYGNRNKTSIMFAKEINKLELENKDQLSVIYIFSQEKVANQIFGRIDKENLEQLLFSGGAITADEYFLCGPGKMIDHLNEILQLYNIPRNSIHFERFNTPIGIKNLNLTDEVISNVMIIIDDEEFEFDLSSTRESILDAAIGVGADIPFSCKGAVCCTCKAKVIEGEAIMDQNYSLSQEEVEQGYILTCQAHPVTENIVIDFDEI